jgi:hypothetical protein
MESRPCGWWMASAVYWRSRARALRAEVANAEAILGRASGAAEAEQARQAVESARQRLERLETEAQEAGAMPDWLH